MILLPNSPQEDHEIDHLMIQWSLSGRDKIKDYLAYNTQVNFNELFSNFDWSKCDFACSNPIYKHKFDKKWDNRWMKDVKEVGNSDDHIKMSIAYTIKSSLDVYLNAWDSTITLNLSNRPAGIAGYDVDVVMQNFKAPISARVLYYYPNLMEEALNMLLAWYFVKEVMSNYPDWFVRRIDEAIYAARNKMDDIFTGWLNSCKLRHSHKLDLK